MTPNKLSNYTLAQRIRDIISVILFFIFYFKITYHVFSSITLYSPYWWIGLLVPAYLVADLFSGIFHWLGDSFGSVDTKWIGPGFIRSFREHHVDPKAITRHDFFEANGANCFFLTLVILIPTYFLMVYRNNVFQYASLIFIIYLSLFILLTNQFHKWAHQDEQNKYILFLQKYRIILNPEDHTIHHTPPYDKYFCVTNGWLNAPLEKIKFFKTIERWIKTAQI